MRYQYHENKLGLRLYTEIKRYNHANQNAKKGISGEPCSIIQENSIKLFVAIVVTKKVSFDSAINFSVAASLLFPWAPASILQDLNKKNYLD